jgi:hypothetical protein
MQCLCFRMLSLVRVTFIVSYECIPFMYGINQARQLRVYTMAHHTTVTSTLPLLHWYNYRCDCLCIQPGMEVRTKSLDMEVTSHIIKTGFGGTIWGEIRVVPQELRLRDTGSSSDRHACVVWPHYLGDATILALLTQADGLHVKQA